MSKNINALIINWYNENKRDLPWRNTKDPYFVWLSEVILQQTRVDQGMAYYLKFTKNFPTIETLAKADEQVVLNNWQGLGYYSRARNLHKAAKILQEQHKGVFPNTHAEIIKLPGVGDYTASAISSFCYDEPQAVLDGNVFRVLSRIFDISTPIDSTQGKKQFRELAQEFLVKTDPATHNQAIMEFGAMQCTPKKPKCETCPIRLNCSSFKSKTHLDLPVKSKKTKVRARKMIFLFAQKEERFVVSKRTKKDIWQHMFQFPLLDETELTSSEYKTGFETLLEGKIKNYTQVSIVTHLLSHQKLTIEFYKGEFSGSLPSDYQLISIDEIDTHPFPRPIEEFLKNLLETTDENS